ncbi:hypothetical protein MUP35_04405 [Patescibacteria group bacterium]|nr:hypothetical protein [Patescibacteria group bacterium]
MIIVKIKALDEIRREQEHEIIKMMDTFTKKVMRYGDKQGIAMIGDEIIIKKIKGRKE